MHASTQPSDPGHHTWTISVQEKTLDRVSEWIRAVDTKASTLLAIDTAMIAIVVALASVPKTWTAETGTWLAVGSLLLIVSLLLVVSATFPQVDGRGRSLIFFGEIASQPRSAYLIAIAARSRESYLEDLNAQCHRNSEIAAQKYRRVRYATICLFLGLLPWLIALFVIISG
jgi:hypothetical protein